MQELFFNAQSYHNLQYHRHSHKNSEIMIVTAGCIQVGTSDETVAVTSGQGVFIPPYYIHSYESTEDSSCHIWEFSSILIPEKICNDLVLFEFPFNGNDCIFSISDMDNIFAKKAAIYRIASIISSAPKKLYVNDSHSICSRTIQFIADNFDKPITLRDAAKHCAVNYSYLSRVFAEEEGISFTECLNGTRLNNAVFLLLRTERTITDIAYACGFGSIRNFNRIFCDKMNCTPIEFRHKSSAVR